MGYVCLILSFSTLIFGIKLSILPALPPPPRRGQFLQRLGRQEERERQGEAQEVHQKRAGGACQVGKKHFGTFVGK